MNRAEKQGAVQALIRDLEATSAVFALDFRGIKVDEVTELRRKVRHTGARYRVVKNSLALRATEGTELAELSSHFQGMTGLAFTKTDPVALAKVLSEFAKEVPALVYKGGVISGKAVAPEQFKGLASLGGREELLAQLLYLFQATVQNVLGVLQAPARDLVLVLKAAVHKASGSGEESAK